MLTFVGMEATLTDIVPEAFRRRSLWVALTIFVRALLHFVGLAVLVPVLILILDSESIHTTPMLRRLYAWGGFADERHFVAAVAMGVVAVIVLKNLLYLWLYRAERNYVYDLYRYFSRRLYITYHRRGLPFLKHQNSMVLARNVNFVTLSFISGVLRPAATIVSDLLLFVLLFGALVLYNPMAAGLAVAIFLPAVAGYYFVVRRRLNSYGESENRAQKVKARTVIESFRGFADIEMGNAFPMMLRRFDRAMDEVVDLQRRNATIGMMPTLLMESGLTLGMVVLILAVPADSVAELRVLFGVFAVAALRLLPSVRNIMTGWSSIRYNRYTMDILREVLSDPRSAEALDDSAERMSFNDRIEVEGLAFRFDDETSERELFRDLSFTIRKGERIGIRGTSGAGKTTLFNLLLGFYEAAAGTIRIDGEALTAENRRRWQNSVGYVSQTVFMIDSSFAENIALGVPAEKIDRERVRTALRQARLEEFIDSLPQGMDTPIGECGCRLSGGQRQRIGIARALYKGVDTLFFDEATSSLDNRTESEINRAIADLAATNRRLTLVVIAHRESSLDFCDRIITLGNG